MRERLRVQPSECSSSKQRCVGARLPDPRPARTSGQMGQESRGRGARHFAHLPVRCEQHGGQ